MGKRTKILYELYKVKQLFIQHSKLLNSLYGEKNIDKKSRNNRQKKRRMLNFIFNYLISMVQVNLKCWLENRDIDTIKFGQSDFACDEEIGRGQPQKDDFIVPISKSLGITVNGK